MKINHVVLIVSLCFLVLFWGCKNCEECEKELENTKSELEICEKKLNNIIPEETTKITSFSLIPTNISELNALGYNDNLDIVDKKVCSFDPICKTITIKTPFPNNRFTHYKTYDISSTTKKAILYVVTDGNTNEARGNPMKFLSYHTFNFSDILDVEGHNANFNLKANDELYTYVLNDNFSVYTNLQIIAEINYYKSVFAAKGSIPCGKNKVAPLPKEGCGGIVII